MEPFHVNTRRRRKRFDNLEYLKFALINCRKTRLNAEAEERLEVPKVKATSANGFTFYYSVSESRHQSEEEDSSDESDSDSEDEIHDHFNDFMPNFDSNHNEDDLEEEEVTFHLLENSDSLTSFEDFFSALKTSESESDSGPDSNSNHYGITDELISGNCCAIRY